MQRLLDMLGLRRATVKTPAKKNDVRSSEGLSDAPEPSKKEIRAEQERELRERLHLSDDWSVDDTQTALSRRDYDSYDQYVEHQRSKLAIFDLSRYDMEYRQLLVERLRTLDAVRRGDAVLCLAARIGTEVKAFIELGCFAVGIDLNPGEDNRYVVHGDFHDLQYADDSLDVVFTNSLDHAFEIDRILREVVRVLKPGGRLIAELVAGTEEGQPPKFFESFAWAHIDDAVRHICADGFRIVDQMEFTRPWTGRAVVFEREE